MLNPSQFVVEDEFGNRSTLAQEISNWVLKFDNVSWYRSGLTLDQLPAMPRQGLNRDQLQLQKRL